MFKNPNDLALNMVAVLPLAAVMALEAGTITRRLTAAASALLMVAAVVASQSRSGSIGLVVMTLMLSAYVVRRRPGLMVAGVLALALAVPFLPPSYWHRLSSITDETQDETGSREARTILLRESFAAFLAHPLTGVGAGQFKNYDPDGRQEAWRESHNVVLQVAAELGVFGVVTFGFLVIRAGTAGRQVRRLLRRAVGAPRLQPERGSQRERLGPAEAARLSAHSAAVGAALAGWFICALFASVAYNWTFYYLLALAIAPREVLLDRLSARVRPARWRTRAPLIAAQEARA
jgi:O-antigen ligase